MNKRELVKNLRSLTQAGFMDCKNALEETNYNLDQAVKLLREKGIAQAAIKSVTKVATEGTTWAKADQDGVALLELNAQTDFVGKSALLCSLAQTIIDLVLLQKTNQLNTIIGSLLADGQTVREACLAVAAKTGEKIELRRICYLPLTTNQTAGVYRHDNGKISSFIVVQGDCSSEALKKVAMHITAMNPKFLDQSKICPSWLANEKEVLTQQLVHEGKPVELSEKIIQGRIQKILKEVCLVNQEYIFEPKTTVGQYLKSLQVIPLKMVRFELGEGMEKVVTDFVEEVKAQMR